MSNYTYLQLQPQPGIQRDGTSIDSLNYTNGQWVRFYKNRAKKMGGYKVISVGNSAVVRNIITYNTENGILAYLGQAANISTIVITPSLTTSAPNDRTPTTFVENTNNIWSITSITNISPVTSVETAFVVATAIPNGLDISNTTSSVVYYGGLYDENVLEPLISTTGTIIETAGCLLNLGSYLLVLGLNGNFFWNDGITLNNFPNDNEENIGTSKFVYAAPVRNSSVLSGLAWTLESVISITQNSTGAFVPTYVSSISTILSSGCVVSYEPYFYWVGSNTFFMYNGAVIEIENNTNKLWFFENLNMNYKQRVVGFVNKKYNEICWLFPYGTSTENNWMIIYNLTTGAWYDTPLERSCAASSSSLFPYPLMASSVAETYNLTTTYPIWAHEYGVNQIDPVRTSAILSSFTTNKLWLIDQNPQYQVLSVDSVIPDVKQIGSMFFSINAQGYPNSTIDTSSNFEFTSDTEFLTVRFKGSILNLTFTSNVLDGDYLFGKTIIKLQITDDQRPGPTT